MSWLAPSGAIGWLGNRHRPGRAGLRLLTTYRLAKGDSSELRAEGLAFTIMFMPPDDEGWMWCNAIIEVPGFRGELDFQLLRSDLDSFRTELAASLVGASWPCEVRL